MKPKLIEQNKARKLRSEGFSVKEIAKKLKVSKSSVSVWVRNVPLGKQQKLRLIKRELWGEEKGRQKIARYWAEYHLCHPKPIPPLKILRFVDNFFNQWTDDMAYILGYFAADGCMYKNKNGSCYITFTSTDKELIDTVKNRLKVDNKIEVYNSPGNKWKIRYNLQIGGKRLFNRFTELGFTPRKSLTLSFPDIPDHVLNHFIRGYFDGDGCASYAERVRKNRRNVFKDLKIRFTSGSESFLKSVQQKLILLAGTETGSLFKKQGNCYDLVYSKRNVVKLYKFMYPSHKLPYLRRKWEILNQGINLMGP